MLRRMSPVVTQGRHDRRRVSPLLMSSSGSFAADVEAAAMAAAETRLTSARLRQAACTSTPVSHSGSITIAACSDVVFTMVVQDLSALHSSNALSKKAAGYLGRRM